MSAAEKCCSISVSCPSIYPQFSVGLLYPNGVCRCASMCAFLYWTISPQTVSLTQSLKPIINYPSSHCSLNELFLNLFPLVSCHMLPLNSVFHLFLYSQNCIKEWQSTTFSCQFTTISCHTNNDKKVAQLAYSTNQLTEFLLLELYIPGWRPRLCLSIILTSSWFLMLLLLFKIYPK